jgi:hypothetical protein
MSRPSSSGTEKTVPPKKGVSPVRNLIGLVVLLAVAAVAWLEFSAKNGYNAAVKALEERSNDETKGLAPIGEAEILIAQSPDGPDSDSHDGGQTFTKRTYIWKGLIKSYTLTVYYTKDRAPGLHHFETEGAPYVPEKPAAVPTAAAAPGPADATGKMQPAMAPIPGAAKAKDMPPTEAPKPAAAPDATTKPPAETPKPAAPPAPAPAKNPNQG